MIGPTGPTATLLLLLRGSHLLSGSLWLGLVLFVDRVWPAFRANADPESAAAARAGLLPRVVAWYVAAALLTVATGFADYVLVLHTEGLAPRVFVWLLAWTVGAGVVLLLLYRSATGRAPKPGPALAAALAGWLLALAASGDWYMRRGGSHKAVALSLGGGLAYVMLANTLFLLVPGARAAEPDRRFVLASRTNLWLALAVLFFMGAASHFPIFGPSG